ncbi:MULTISPECIES: TrkH family potassium uptake protein [Carboxydothermus]|uniref:Trk system potassium uptake protein TrkH n=1 Tax=Carboxydothermus ferrireducens DSM 11255 TaxID=1119529 RepID=A0ABX2RAY0_9THEO|nr:MULTISPECIES: TrkH family potassium uptake protein [Carboxydothermus]NYE58341.1 trk system potassium uptake protein TrkH [Carboxydothermus ferrireducens DSM 11255]
MKVLAINTKKEINFFRRLTPSQILVLGFAGVILLGTVLLMLPISTKDGTVTPFLDALFTATSAVCVTGLVVVDTGTYWSLFGQIVILLLIQVGGLGFMTIATLFAILLGRRINLRERIVIQEALNQASLEGIIKLTKQVILFTFSFEGVFAVILGLRFSLDYGFIKGMWFGVFHAVSAFNNAGFDLIGNFKSLTPYVGDVIVNLSIAILIIAGGIGFYVISELFNLRKKGRLSLHSKITLMTTGLLLLVGTLVIFVMEYNNDKTLGALPFGEKILAAFFQAVTPRTAGFNTVDIAALHPATQYFIIILMFIGASPGSTGGGVKTTTFAVLTLAVINIILGRDEILVYNRRLPREQIFKAIAIVMISLSLINIVTFILTFTEGHNILMNMFETVSAFGTVGLSMGLTPKLSELGRILIILMMFFGRVGPLTITYALAQRRKKALFTLPEEKVMVG